MKSERTFADEFGILSQHVPEALYFEFEDPSVDFFTSELSQYLRQQLALADGHKQPTAYHENHHGFFLEDPTSEWLNPVDINSFLDQMEGSNRTEAGFIDAFYQHFGFSALAAFEYFSKGVSKVNLANLIDDCGKEAFGCYLPMHAYFQSKQTPWGIYLFPELIIQQAATLYKEVNSGLHWWQHMVFYLYAVYRHELFHFQVERFATRLEMLFNKPFYKPYITYVENLVAKTSGWLEEALAENSVLNSKLVYNRTGIKSNIFKEIYLYDLQSMPPGYSDYHCREHGGPENAILKLSSQIANCSVDPTEKLTSLMTIKIEYGFPDKRVPGYTIINPHTKTRFQ